ncbi:MAG: NUDIX hydrolase, partial [Oscillospiraceae bacterium]|nr:NUDIX hydrolase [Oscillospiraceae bacterium]
RQRLTRNQKGQTLEEFLAAYHPGDYPRPSVTVDLLVFSLEGDKPELLMIRRGNHPYLDCWALPGGFVEPEEYTLDAAARELEEETHVSGLALAELGLFSGPKRDPRNWTMTDAYLAVADRSTLPVRGDDDAADAGWFAVDCAREGDLMRLTLTGEGEVLTAEVTLAGRDTALGPVVEPVGFVTDDIAFDHSKMIVAGLLALERAGRL